MKKDVYIIDAKRTPIGKYGGILSETPATELGSIVIKNLLSANSHIKKQVDEVIMGNVLSAGLGQNPARIAAFHSGLPEIVPAMTINKVCGSGLKSVILGVQSIQNEDAEVIIAGGMENMSRAPYLVDDYRFGVKLGDQQMRDEMIVDGLFCSLINEVMGVTGENIARKYRISKQQQDKYALSSHQKALAAIDSKKFAEEIVPVGETTTDEQPRRNTSLEALTKLSPVFKKGGTVTAGNSSSLNDGAAAVLLTSEQFSRKHSLKPMARVVSYAFVGLDPHYMGLGGYYAAKKCLEKANLTVSDIDLWEINEAFASQSIAVQQLLKIDSAKINVNGGALALGHPIGASGARILTTLVHELKRRSNRYGIASLCIGGGQGIAMLIEML